MRVNELETAIIFIFTILGIDIVSIFNHDLINLLVWSKFLDLSSKLFDHVSEGCLFH